jgi:hypothetical protein
MLDETQQPLLPDVHAALESGAIAEAVELARRHGYT